MSASLAFLAIIGALSLGVVSPGASFVMVLRTSLAVSRRAGVAAALGMGAGGVAFAGLALLGLQAVIAQAAWAYLGLKLIGAGYLLTLAWRMWRGADTPLEAPRAPALGGGSAGRAFALGLATQLSNPKTAIVYASVFAALLPTPTPTWLMVALPPAVFTLETSWYAVVALVASAEGPRDAYGRAKRWIDRLAGAVMAGLGARLILDAVRPG
jgi:threonine/homoserine/homoserine lactone efflux protein